MGFYAPGCESSVFLERLPHGGFIHPVHPVIGTVEVEVPFPLGALEQDKSRDVCRVERHGGHLNQESGK